MHNYTPGEWVHAQDKRCLSLLDKHTLPADQGYALIMPGEPGTEFEELVRVGFPTNKIVCIDNTDNPYLKQALSNSYGDQFVNSDVFEFIRKSKKKFSYMHFDMCCISSGETHSHLLDASRLLKPDSRLRYSGVRTYRGVTAKERVKDLRKNFLSLKAFCDARSGYGEFWSQASHACDNADDEAGAIIAGIFCNTSMNINRVYKKHYLGNNKYTNMFTFWLDFTSEPADEVTRRSVVAKILEPSSLWKPEYNEEGPAQNER